MKKASLIYKLCLMVLVFCVSIPLNAKSKKPKKVFKYKLEVVSNVSEKAKLLTFDGVCFDYNKWVTNFQIKNGNDERISIEWENARFANYKVVFGDDSKLTMRNPKVDEVVTANGVSIKRNITGLDCVDSSSLVFFLFPYNDLKKNIGTTASKDILIPVKYSDNSVEDILLRLTVWYELQETMAQ